MAWGLLLTHHRGHRRNLGTRVYNQSLYFIKTIKKIYIYLQLSKTLIYLHRVNFKMETGGR